MAVSANNQCYAFAKGLDDSPYVNVASDSGSWSGWQQLPNPGQTSAPFGAAAIGSRIYLFAKGVKDNMLYVRRTAT